MLVVVKKRSVRPMGWQHQPPGSDRAICRLCKPSLFLNLVSLQSHISMRARCPSFSIASRAVRVFRICRRTCSNHLPIVEIVDDLRLGSAQHVVKRNKCGRSYTCGVLMSLSLAARCGASLHRSRIRTILSASSADGLGSHTV
jgi:hypothetical protein